jgi:hypothetical protein
MNQSVCFLKDHVLLKLSFILSTLISCSPPSPQDGANPIASLLPLIVIGIVIVIVFRKRIFIKRERVAPYEVKIRVESQQYAKKTISICCGKCGQKYILGKDALVMTSFGLAGSFGSASYSAGDSSFINNSNDPDMVDSINGTWDELEHSTKLSQEAEINRLEPILTSGRSRWWRCQKCFEVQTYKPV